MGERVRRVRDNLWIHTSHFQQLQSVVLVQADAVYVFDPGYFEDEIADIRSLAKQYESDHSLRTVLTHSDFDHIAGVHHFEHFPGHSVWAASTWDVENEVRAIGQMELFDSEFYVQRPWTGKMGRVSIDKKLHDGDCVANLSFLHAKGHTCDGLVTVFGTTAVVGDYLSALEFPFIYTSYIDYVHTMQHLKTAFEHRGVDLVIPQHGPIAEGRKEVERRFAIAEDYLSQLEHVIREALQTGRDVDETVKLGEAHVTFDGRPISRGLMPSHKDNVKLAWNELF